MATDIFGKALIDYQNGNYTEDIRTFSSLEEEDKMPLPYLFRTYEEMPLLEQKALARSSGTVLDIGCGAGSHSLYLQNQGFDVTALDSSAGAIETCLLRGVLQTILGDIHSYNTKKFDTLLLLMNGIGIVGQYENLNSFLAQLKQLLRPKGQILVDSSDIIYMFEEEGDELPATHYYGEVQFQMEYKGQKSAPFSWLYLKFEDLKRAAEAQNLKCELIAKGEHYDYLARLSPAVYS